MSERPLLIERLLVWGLAFAAFAACAPRILTYLHPVTGDEVFYLITTQSILYDHDLNESNQYADKSWREFYPTCAEVRAPDFKGIAAPGVGCTADDNLDSQATHARRPGTYTKHGLALSFLIAPAFAIGGRAAVVTFLNGLAALLALNVFLLAWEATGRRRVAWLCWATLAFTPPIFQYAFLIFPQPVGALCVLYAFRRARYAALGRLDTNSTVPSSNSFVQSVTVALCIGILPWLHNLYLILSVALLGYFYLGGRRPVHAPVSRRALVREWGGNVRHDLAVLLILTVLAALYVGRHMYLYGVPWPNPRDHDPFSPPLMLPVGLLGLLFDQKYGLLTHNPIYLIPIAWLFRIAFARRRLGPVWDNELIWLLTVIGPYYLVVADYSRWWGQWCPPARYVLPIAPLLVLPMARALVHARSRFLSWYLRVATVWAATVSVVFVVNPKLSYNWEDPRPAMMLRWLEDHYAFLKRIALANFFPYYVNYIDPLTPIYYCAHVVWLALAVWLGWRMVGRVDLDAAQGGCTTGK